METYRILFANIPADGHFYPMTGIAMALKEEGHDVRWYTSKMFTEKLKNLGIPHYAFKKALEVNQFNIDEFFPERKKIKAAIPRLKFDLKNFFVYRSPEYLQDITEIKKEFPFDVLVSDATFTAAEFVKEKLEVPSVAVGVIPIMSTSKDLAPSGLGLTPANSFPGRLKQSALRFIAKNILFKEATSEYNKLLRQHRLPTHNTALFDIPAKRADIFLQSGSPGFEYQRSDMPTKLRFVGPLHAHRNGKKKEFTYEWKNKLNKRSKKILISQGTFESDPTKLIIPSIEALKNENYLLIVATGYHHTEELRKKYNRDNIVIEDFIDFDHIMPLSDLYITNGGYGGTLLAIDHGLPMIAAGVNEGKNEICARIGYFKLGIDLKTEKPTPEKINLAVNKIFSEPQYKENVNSLRNEFRQYDTNALCIEYILQCIKAPEKVKYPQRSAAHT